ncbi:hypothetical protein A8C32_10010 [Flavivirga aquatica]|uniref:Uncharacterized protein n=1 Tax=Flavivirga aquatica TaxID=1849968 RepID=A0A1E5TEN4_9FLAO|nr:hypothetical protein A8C32_10010 [Flavivirga aquatica]
MNSKGLLYKDSLKLLGDINSFENLSSINMFFKEPKFKHVNYKNRERICLALKKQHSTLEKNRK